MGLCRVCEVRLSGVWVCVGCVRSVGWVGCVQGVSGCEAGGLFSLGKMGVKSCVVYVYVLRGVVHMYGG